MARRGQTDLWIKLDDASSGQVRIKTEWLDLSSDRMDYLRRVEEVQDPGSGDRSGSTAVLLVYVDSCKMLPLAKSGTVTIPGIN